MMGHPGSNLTFGGEGLGWCFAFAFFFWCWVAVVGQGETVSTVDNHPADNPQTGKFTWTLDHFSKINLRKHYSECFMVGGYKW
jgi:hypothetical protein